MPARRREAIVASVCRVLHGRRVPGDAWGLDLATILARYLYGRSAHQHYTRQQSELAVALSPRLGRIEHISPDGNRLPVAR